MSRLCLIRNPSEAEKQLLSEFWNRQVGLYTSDTESAKNLTPAQTATTLPQRKWLRG